METNKYPLPVNDEVDARELAALLAELKDVGGSAAESGKSSNGRPFGSFYTRRGTVGSTNVLKDQQLRAGGGLNADNGTGSGGVPSGRRTGPVAPHSQRDSISAGSATSRPLAPIGFSTYSPADTELTEAQLNSQRLSATPLGVRLAPLADVAEGAEQGMTPTSKLAHPSRALRSPSFTPPGIAGDAPRRPHSSRNPPPPLPSLTKSNSNTTKDGAAVFPSENVGSAVTTGVFPWAMPGAALTSANSKGADNREGEEGVPTHAPDAVHGGADTESMTTVSREVNFLPIMCARYLRPVGLTPTARWGHTLTPINSDMMLLFGGVDIPSTETASLMAFNTTTISWEPLYSFSEGPVARHSHAACAYDGRYLVISGGVALHGSTVLSDIHVYDTLTHHWSCIWDKSHSTPGQNHNDPGPRYGHTMVLQDDRLYIYGGKTVSEKRHHTRRRSSAAEVEMNSTTAAATLASGCDIFVFSLNSYRYGRRIRAHGERNFSRSASITAAAEGNSSLTTDDALADTNRVTPNRPAARAYHAACIRGNVMYINGGSGGTNVLTDTWSVTLNTGEWRCLHHGGTADAVPREKHALFVCGEALLLVGGCSGGGGLHERITNKFTLFAVVLPLLGASVETPCWIPVAMGNVSIVQPHKKGFAAALVGGFVYVFGGVCGAEPATNSMVRFLAADGYISQNDVASAAAAGSHDGGAQQLRIMMQQLREQQRGTPFDCYVYAGSYGSADVTAAVAQLPPPWMGSGPGAEELPLQRQKFHAESTNPWSSGDEFIAGLHRAIVHQRAPLLLKQLEACRYETYSGFSNVAAGTHRGGSAINAEEQTPSERKDEVDALLQQVAEGHHQVGSSAISSLPSKETSAATAHKTAFASGTTTTGLPVYFTNSTARIPGLTNPLSAAALQCLVDYIYWGGLKAKYRVLLEVAEEGPEEGDGAEGDNSNPGHDAVPNHASVSAEHRAKLMQTLECVKKAADTYNLAPLVALCAGLLCGDRERVQLARQRSSEQLQRDMAAMLTSSGNLANTTVLVVDPHTKAQSAHTLHACILLAASALFTELLRPLYRAVSSSAAGAGKGSIVASNQVGSLAAKLSAAAAASPAALLTNSSKRTVLLGPVPLPLPAVQPILRYLYTRQLRSSTGMAFEVMLGAHQLGLTELQALCEAVVAREEVNYQTCCSFYYLARNYQASLLEEIALLTAVTGFAEVRLTPSYLSLSSEARQQIDAVAAELGSSTWVPPPQPAHEIKSKATYHAMWTSSSPSP